ncbi:hypothetical protein BJV82DRAFT_574086 [Fennellomyces sp. T-0311]|nr:hypothetical protein BJV82DRAFT_574086 [Fennellomyces sp. T-0311]
MNLIYKNAQCALALIPGLMIIYKSKEFDIRNPNSVQDIQWSKRIWTVEEVYMSKQVLFVSTDAYFILSNWITLNGAMKGFEFIDNTREKRGLEGLYGFMVTKKHGEISTLVNIFPGLKDGIHVQLSTAIG